MIAPLPPHVASSHQCAAAADQASAPVERQEYADESGLKKYSYSNMPWEDAASRPRSSRPDGLEQRSQRGRGSRRSRRAARRDLAGGETSATYAPPHPSRSAAHGLPPRPVPRRRHRHRRARLPQRLRRARGAAVEPGAKKAG